MKPIIHHGVELTVSRINTARLKVDYKGFRVCEGKTKKECLEALELRGDKEEFLRCIEAADARIFRREEWPKLSKRFYELFGFAPPLCEALCFLREKGLDVRALDDRMKPPDGTSLEDWVIERKGQEAADVVRRMLGLEVETKEDATCEA